MEVQEHLKTNDCLHSAIETHAGALKKSSKLDLDAVQTISSRMTYMDAVVDVSEPWHVALLIGMMYFGPILPLFSHSCVTEIENILLGAFRSVYYMKCIYMPLKDFSIQN